MSHVHRRPLKLITIVMSAALALTVTQFSGVGGSPQTAGAATARASVVRITTGPKRYMATSGKVWKPLAYHVSGQRRVSKTPIKRTSNDYLYQRTRTGMSAFNIPRPMRGTYRVKLFLAETYYSHKNRRVFDVRAEGRLKASKVDIFARAGKNRATWISFPVAVNDGVLNLKFVSRTGRASVGAIRVNPISVTGPAPSMPTTTAPPPRWKGDFESGSLSQYSFASQNSPCRIKVYSKATKPLGAPNPRQGKYAAQYNTYNNCAGSNVRTQTQIDNMFRPGDDVYIGWSTYFPKSFPKILDSKGGYFVFMSSFGAPFSGSSNNTMGVYTEADGVTYIERRYGDGHKLWKKRLPTGRWVDFVRHIKYSKNAKIGFDELWVNGSRQHYSPVRGTSGVTLAADGKRLYLRTMNADASGRYEFHLSNYRLRGQIPGVVTIYHDAAKIGSRYASVAP